MTKDEALKLALEAFEWNYNTDLDNIPACEKWAKMLKENITAIKEALSNDTSQERVDEIEKQRHEPVVWKLVPIKPTNEMLKAMDECSTEGYDERLYAGHAASVYMAAVDVAPTPPHQPVSNTDELAQPEQEPEMVGRITDNIKDMVLRQEVMLYTDKYLTIGTPVYTTPPQRKPLTDKGIEMLWPLRPTDEIVAFARAIEAAHGIKGKA